MKRDEKNEYLKNLKGRKFLILGGGLSGRAATKLLENLSQKLLLCDKTPQMGLNCPQETDELKNFRYFKPDLIIKSPGISPDHPILQSAKQTQTPIWSEIDLAYLFFKGKIIAITGTDGKSTSTALTGHLLQASGFKTKTGGNIGLPFSEICLDDIDLAVLELSSYQLDDSQFFRAETGCILNIAPDHLERHKTMENYAEAKKKIFLENTNSILNEKLKNLYELNKETFPNLIFFGRKKEAEAKIWSEKKQISSSQKSYDYSQFPLQGAHNEENLAASLLISEPYFTDLQALEKAIGSFKGLEHRFEDLGFYKNCRFINDSKATNLHSLLSGLKGISQKTETILILGGEPKNESLTPLFSELQGRNINLFLFGKAAEIWEKEFFHLSTVHTLRFKKNLKEVMAEIPELILEKEVKICLFSPACASFDQYKNFEERGKHFKSLFENFSKSY